ncbi:methyl-accepting chemotaxis protein [Bradyrhizobium sp. S69]|uniref:methyl-accepting chemotaxis protein n=1 Tax=Bradyrhizobium sp. S69 TaxID=1641856 RepID=UPI00131BB1C9|nr:methyl-accepting chemotaxis protein [Bradyrhizobium sp. S69]
MSLLARVKIITKILAVILLLGAVAVGTSWLGIRAMSSMNDDAETMTSSAKRALEAARASTSVMSLSSAEFQVALDPRPENRATVRKIVDEQMKLFKERFEDFGKTRDEKTRAMLPAIGDTMAAYEKSLQNTLRLADEASGVELAEHVERLRASAVNSQISANELRAHMRTVVESLDDRVDAFARHASEEYRATSRQLTIVATIGILFGILAGYLIGQFGIVRPINLLKAVMEAFARNDLKADVPGLERRDELGDMARTVEVFKKNGLEVARLRTEQEASEKRLAEQRKADMNKLANDFEGAVGEIIETVSQASTELEASATALTATAVHATEVTTAVAAASEEASTNVQAVASATEEMASSVNEISRQVQESARMASEAVDQARKTNDRVGELSKAAARIGDVVELINTIAGQTNLLALNATIEAARAGEAGRGFAVVASEVKALAEQTAKATGEIGQQIAGIQSATQDSVNAIREISGTIEKLSEISSTIAAAVEQQGAATQEISRNVQQAAQGTQQVSSNITDVQRGAGETGSASSQVLSAAQSLSRDSNRLKLEVGEFLTTVRAA